MILNFTKEIELGKTDAKIYKSIRIFIYILAVFILAIIIYRILFPVQILNYSFTMPATNKGNVLNPRDNNDLIIQDGNTNPSEQFIFDASPLGTFSKVSIKLNTDKKSSSLEGSEIEFKKSFRSALYPEGSPIGLKDGSLVTLDEKYFIVSDKKLREFENEMLLTSLGFKKESFNKITSADFSHNEIGEKIINKENYPNSSFFKINDRYYKLENQSLFEFSSEKAFLSGYDKNQAIEKNKDFIKKYPISEKLLGYCDGSIISYGESAFIVSRGKIWWIGAPEIFIGQGFDWNDVIKAGSDEISLYEREKIFTLLTPHPDGTIFLTNDTKKYYIIEDGKRHLLPTENIAKTYLKKKPILISSKSLEIAGKCILKKSRKNSYGCKMILEDSNKFPGQYYEFKLITNNDTKIDNLNVSYKRETTKNNLKISISGMIQKMKNHFGLNKSS